jgi:hypothetical protein
MFVVVSVADVWLVGSYKFAEVHAFSWVLNRKRQLTVSQICPPIYAGTWVSSAVLSRYVHHTIFAYIILTHFQVNSSAPKPMGPRPLHHGAMREARAHLRFVVPSFLSIPTRSEIHGHPYRIRRRTHLQPHRPIPRVRCVSPHSPPQPYTHGIIGQRGVDA